MSITNILTNTGVTDVTPCIGTTDTIPSIGTSEIIPNISITYVILSIVIIDIIPLCLTNYCYPAKKLFEEILTLNREKHYQLLEVKNQRNLTNINKHEFTKIKDVKQTHSSPSSYLKFLLFWLHGYCAPYALRIIKEEREEEVIISLPTVSHFHSGIKATVPNPL